MTLHSARDLLNLTFWILAVRPRLIPTLKPSLVVNSHLAKLGVLASSADDGCLVQHTGLTVNVACWNG